MYTIKDLLNNVEEIAQSVLHRVFGNNVLFPIEVDEIARNFNVPVYLLKDLDDDLSGCFVAKSGNVAIVLNEKNAKVRQRFTLAHELGHFISYKMQNKLDTDKIIIDNRDTLAGKGTDKEEIFANKFAAEILMPKKQFAEKQKEYNDNSSALAKYFYLSTSAINIRKNYIEKL